jgi:hypothetical protein
VAIASVPALRVTAARWGREDEAASVVAEFEVAACEVAACEPDALPEDSLVLAAA